MNLIGAEHEPLRSTSVELASGSPDRVITLVRRAGTIEGDLPFDVPTLDMPQRHALELRDVDPRRLESVLLTTYERAPQDFETLLGMEGVGARTLRALALVSEVIHGTPASLRDPARFAFAHGTVRVRGPSSQRWLVASLRDATRWDAVPG